MLQQLMLGVAAPGLPGRAGGGGCQGPGGSVPSASQVARIPGVAAAAGPVSRRRGRVSADRARRHVRQCCSREAGGGRIRGQPTQLGGAGGDETSYPNLDGIDVVGEAGGAAGGGSPVAR